MDLDYKSKAPSRHIPFEPEVRQLEVIMPPR